MNQRQIAAKSAVYLIGNLSSKFMSAILIPIYAFFVSSMDLGTFDYSQSIMNVLVPVLFVVVWEGVLKFVLVSKEEEVNGVIQTSTVFVIVLSIIYIAIAIIGSIVVKNRLIWLGTWGMIITHGLAQTWQYMCRALKETKQYVYASMISAAVHLLMTIVFVCVLDWDLFGLFMAYAVGQIALIAVIEMKISLMKRFVTARIDIVLLKRMLAFSIPLMFNTLSMWLTPLLMRTVILRNIGVQANGLYAFANKFNIVVTLLGTVVNMALVEEAIITSKEGRISSEYGKTVTKIFVMFEQLTAVAIFFIAMCYVMLKNTEYYVTVQYFGWLLMAALLSNLGSNIGTVFQSINITKYQFTTTLMGTAVGLVFAYALSSIMGMWGILIGQMMSSFVTMESRYLVARKKSIFRLDWKQICSNGTMVFIAVVMATFCNNSFVLFATVAIAVGWLVWKNKEMIKRERRRLKKS